MATIVSVSRRTDIPAFYAEWFMNRVRTGYCMYQPPMNPAKTISLGLEDVLAFIFWSRNYSPMIEKGQLLQLKKTGYDFFMHFTIVGYPTLFDSHVISPERAVAQFRFLSETFGKNTLCWRFDPIVVSSETTLDERLEMFQNLVKLLGGYTDRCIISMIALYKKSRQNMAKRGIECYDPINDVGPVSWEDLRLVLKQMSTIANDAGIQMYSCCERQIRDDAELNIKQGRCIDKSWISEIIRDPHKREQVLGLSSDYGQRKKFDCGCIKSVDVGVYDTCPHGCAYCYANRNKELAMKRYTSHNPSEEMIFKS